MPKITVGVVGAGWVAQDRYLPVLDKQSGVTILGIADHNEERAREVASRYGTRAFRSSAELLAEGPQVIFICTSPFTHASIAEEAMSGGAHVFVEKPMAVDVGDAERMVEVAGSTGKALGVSHNLLFSRSVRRALGRLDSGRYGGLEHVLAVQSTSPHRRLPHWYSQLPGGLFYDEAPHMVYLIDRVLRSAKVDGGWAQKSPGSDEFSALGADFVGRGGARATMRMLFEAPVSEWLLTLVMEGGVSVIDLFRDIEIFVPPDGSHGPRDILMTSVRSIIGHTAGTIRTGVRYLTGNQRWGHDLIIGEYLRNIRAGLEAPITGNDGLRVTRLLWDVLDIVGEGRSEPLT